ncbi:M56 family metallopeptidase [Winogradskyella pulchriflava]|uniref:M56 family metallopeptidase n=1 Tax=Winogradskyella pulchriflava TaxID=1110688 RepID=A0ABV6QAL7_9FLAO
MVGILASVFIPLIVIPIYVEITPSIVETSMPFAINSEIHQTPDTTVAFDWLQLLFTIYSIGVAFFLSKLLIELASLKLLFNKHNYYRNGSYLLIETENNIPPFSFFNWIVYNPNKYSKEELQHILNHEKAHANELHSIDIIITQLACVLFWFNPFIWLYRKEIQQNLEFIADKKAQNFSECEKSYQLVLLKSSIPKHNLLVTNNFYNSQIKKRIIMLHKTKSNRLNAWKYGLILPALALFLMSFNTKEVFIEIEDQLNLHNTPQIEASVEPNNFNDHVDFDKETETEYSKSTNTPKKNNQNNNLTTQASSTKAAKNSSNVIGDISITIIDKNTTDSELDKIKEDLKKQGLTIKFKSVKRNKEGEIMAIKIDAKSKNSSTNYHISSDDETIEPIKIVFDEENNTISIGNGHAKHGKNTYVYETRHGGKHKIHKTGSGSNVYVISDDENEHDSEYEHDAKVIVRSNGKKGKLKKVKHSTDVHVISGDNDEVIEVIIDEDGDDKEVIEEKIIINGKGNSKNVWVSKKDDSNVIILNDSDSKNKIYFASDDNKTPLIIIDGKESTKEDMNKILPDAIESVTVLKDKSAFEKYGDKGKDGVLIIKTKKD